MPLAEPDPGSGTLYYTDEDCKLRAAELPDIRPDEAPNWDDCQFTLSPDATRVGEETTGWDPHSDPRRGRLFRTAGATIVLLLFLVVMNSVAVYLRQKFERKW